MDADMQHDEKLLPQMLAILTDEFRERQHGESKLDTLVAGEYLMLIADKLVGHILPIRFALFAFGGIGLFVHIGVLWFALTVAGRRSIQRRQPLLSSP